MPWSAAIGRLDAQDGSCSATLIRPDVILTASHCLYGRGSQTKITDFTFTPALDVGRERLKPVEVTSRHRHGLADHAGQQRQIARRAQRRLGGAAHFAADRLPGAAEGRKDRTSTASIERMEKGSTLSHAGYGVYGAFYRQAPADARELPPHPRCR